MNNTSETLEKVRTAIYQQFRRTNQRAYAWKLAKYYLRIENDMPSRKEQEISKELNQKINAKIATIVKIAIDTTPTNKG